MKPIITALALTICFSFQALAQKGPCTEEFVRAESAKQSPWLGNPVEGERDSGLKPNTIPL
jgi:hypothetical protein